jgi:hypothetical protein
MRMFRLATGALLLGLATACADLGAVRDFGKLSSSIAGYPNLMARYIVAPTEISFYRNPLQASQNRDEEVRKEQVQRAVNMQRAVAEYMSSIAKLAADDLIRTDFKPLAEAASKAGAFPPEAAGAASSIAKLLTDAALGAYRQRQLAQVLEAGEAPLQTLLGVLGQTVGEAAALADTQLRQAVSDRYGVALRQTRDPAAQILAAQDMRARLEAIDERAAGRDAYVAALKRISEGHTLLVQNRNRLSASETVAQIRAVEDQLRDLGRLIAPALGL